MVVGARVGVDIIPLDKIHLHRYKTKSFQCYQLSTTYKVK